MYTNFYTFQYTPEFVDTPSLLQESPYFKDVKINFALIATIIYCGMSSLAPMFIVRDASLVFKNITIIYSAKNLSIGSRNGISMGPENEG